MILFFGVELSSHLTTDTGRPTWPAWAERRLLYLLHVCSSWVLPRCCHSYLKIFTHQIHAYNQQFSSRSNILHDLCYITCLKPLAIFFISLQWYSWCYSYRSLEDLRNVGWDSFTKCTLYVFQSLSKDPLSISVPIQLIVYSSSFSSYLIILLVC